MQCDERSLRVCHTCEVETGGGEIHSVLPSPTPRQDDNMERDIKGEKGTLLARLFLALSLLVFLSPPCNSAQELWGRRKVLRVPSGGGAALAEFDVSEARGINASNTLLVRAILIKGGGDASRVALNALWGDLTTSWSLSSKPGFSEALLCSDARSRHDRATVVARVEEGDQDAEVRVEIVTRSIALEFDREVEAVVSPEKPLTMLVDPVKASQVFKF